MPLARTPRKALLAAPMIILSCAAAPSVHASVDSPALNGIYRATSDGTQAKTNDSFKPEAVVVSTWSINSTCSNPMDCSGHVKSDQGWQADLRMYGGNLWFIRHNVENWERCQDGSTAIGEQIFKFSADDELSGYDTTRGPSGACGVNKWLVVDMPFKLVKIG